MQKWIGVGRITDEPKEIMLEEQNAILIWVNVPRSWKPSDSDNIPVIFLGKRADALKQASTGVNAIAGALVYVMGELASRIKIMDKREVTIGCAVFATSIEFWDVENIKDFTDKKPQNKHIFFSEEIDNG